MAPNNLTNVVALLGDLVGSRAAADRVAVHEKVLDVLAEVNTRIETAHPLRPTMGDEFQGIYATLGHALAASFEIRLRLGLEIPVRFGVGRGDVQSIDVTHGIQDGSAWWSARAAIDSSELRAEKSQTRFARTSFQSEADDTSYVIAVQTSLDLVDYIFATLKPKDYVIVLGLRTGQTQGKIASDLGATQQAVSGRLRRTGAGALLHALSALEGVA